MNAVIKTRIVELEKEVDALEMRMLKAFDSGADRIYNNLKNEQTAKVNELKKLRLRIK